MMRLLKENRGGSPPLILGLCAVMVLLLLFLGLTDLLGVLALRQQVQGALVTSTRASARQFDRQAWVLQHRLVLDPPNHTFTRLMAANLELDGAGLPLRTGGLIDGPVQTWAEITAGPGGGQAVTGRVVVPIRTRFLGHRATLRLEYTSYPHVVGS